MDPPQPTSLLAYEPYWKSNLADPTWEHEPGDEIAPRGFVGDFILSLKGIGTTTLFSLWTGLFVVSSVIRRAAYIEWFPKPLVGNLYVVLSAPPGVLKKTTLIDYASSLLRNFPYYLSNPALANQKRPPLLQGEITPEALHYRLVPEETSWFDPVRKQFVRQEGESHLIILASELANVLDTRSYKEALVGMLTSLYDGRQEGDERHTRKDGPTRLRNVFVNLLGGLTPDQMRELPEIVLGGGFMSRTILVYQERPTRIYPIPRSIPGAPDVEELSKRLAWIAEHCYGQYILSEEAYEVYDQWYRWFVREVMDPKSSVTGEERNRMARMDTLLLRVAMLLRAQRYEIGNEIERQDIELAKEILMYTHRQNVDTVEQVSSPQDARAWSHFLQRVLTFIQKNGTVRRPTLLQRMYKWGNTKKVNEAVQQLHDMGCVRIFNKKGDVQSEVGRATSEVYEFVKGLPSTLDVERVALTQSWKDQLSSPT